MKVAVMFSGGKDSTLATVLAKKHGCEISCLISIVPKNQDSFMFHTPSISKTKKQAEKMNIPIIIQKSEGRKEDELKDLEKAIKKAIKKYEIKGVVTGAVESVYQSKRIQKICNKLKIECFNPLWQKNQEELLGDLQKEKIEAIVIGVAAYPLGKKILGKKIDKNFIKEMKILNKKYKINSAGEGGEFESFVLSCSLFKNKIKIKNFKDSGEKNSWRRELIL
jgi:asparagine synthase (glutamine-hydrolysing)